MAWWGHSSVWTQWGRTACLVVICVVAGSRAASGDILVYWIGLGTTWSVGTVKTDFAIVKSEDGDTAISSPAEPGSGESHMVIVCEGMNCRLSVNCESCHTASRAASTFTRPVFNRHQSTYFRQAAMPLAESRSVAYGTGYVQMTGGRLLLLDRDRKPRFRLPPGATLLRDTRTGQPAMLLYPGTRPPEIVK